MSRILYGVMGDAQGHVSRALAVAQAMSQHEFLFVGGGKVRNFKKVGFDVAEIPMISTFYSNNRVDLSATAINAAKQFIKRKRTLNTVVGIANTFQPDIILTDYEMFCALAARRLGIPCISIDHQHFFTECMFEPIKGQPISRLLYQIPLKTMYSKSDYYLITSFFPLVSKNPLRTTVFAPLLDREVKNVTSTKGDHLLVYQTSPTFKRLFPVLAKMSRRCLVYGVGDGPSAKNLSYKGFSRQGFLKDLASCCYVIVNGGHNVISEALYYGKPVFSFPIHLAYEQYVNAQMLARLGYGAFSSSLRPDLGQFEDFEKRLDRFGRRIAKANFSGVEKLTAKLDEIISKHVN